MSNLYTSGEYLKKTESWHAEDSPWKAQQIMLMLRKNDIHPKRIAEIGCGAGLILDELSKQAYLQDTQFKGYDISPQAIELCRKIGSKRVDFVCQDLFAECQAEPFGVLLVIDVVEHVPDYVGFIEECKTKAEYKVYHFPLDIHVSSVLRNSFVRERYAYGHLHYFTAESVIAALKDTDHQIIDYFYTYSAFQLFKHHPSTRKAIAHGVRWLASKWSVSLTARVFGGYSLMVLAK